MPQIIFTLQNLVFPVKTGTELRRLSELYPNFPIKFGCGRGICGVCAVRIIQGEENLSPKTEQEIETIRNLKLHDKRLACQCAINGNATVES